MFFLEKYLLDNISMKKAQAKGKSTRHSQANIKVYEFSGHTLLSGRPAIMVRIPGPKFQTTYQQTKHCRRTTEMLFTSCLRWDPYNVSHSNFRPTVKYKYSTAVKLARKTCPFISLTERASLLCCMEATRHPQQQ